MKFKLILVLSMIVALNVKAQQDSLKKTTITLAAIYSSNISYYGQVTNEKLPYILANATVRFPIGLYICRIVQTFQLWFWIIRIRLRHRI
jgi:hypothetical protein